MDATENRSIQERAEDDKFNAKLGLAVLKLVKTTGVLAGDGQEAIDKAMAPSGAARSPVRGFGTSCRLDEIWPPELIRMTSVIRPDVIHPD